MYGACIPLRDQCSKASRREHGRPSQSPPKTGSHEHPCWLRSRLPGGLGEIASRCSRHTPQCQTPCIPRFPLPKQFRGESCCIRPQPAPGECGTTGCGRDVCPVKDVRQEIVESIGVRDVPFGLGQQLRFSDGGPWSWCVLKGGWYVERCIRCSEKIDFKFLRESSSYLSFFVN